MSSYKNRLMSGIICFVMVFCAMAGVFAPRTAAADFTVGVVIGADLRLRDAPAIGNIIGYLSLGATVDILSEVMVGSEKWYQVNCVISGEAKTGYVHAGYITAVVNDPTFEAYLTAQNFPESYKKGLRALHTIYPNWVFEAVQTGLDWNTVIAAESAVGKNLVPRSSDAAYINGADVDASGIQIGRDGYSWVAASSAAVAYYMDPRNFLIDPYIFQFENLAYSAACHTIDGVNNIISGTFMASATAYNVGGVDYTYATGFIKAAQDTGVSPYHLAARVRQEQSLTGTVLSAGIVPGYEGYFNLFNYGAYTTSTASAAVNGAIYASRVSESYYGPWTNPILSLFGGAKMLSESYIGIGQNTLYFQKFNVVVTSCLYSHQYMTNVMAPKSESSSLKSAYDATMLSSALCFKIPVYTGMPEAAVGKPTPVDPTFGTAYAITPGRLGAVAEGTSVAAFKSCFTVTNGSVRVLTSSGSLKTAGTIGTGDVVQIMYSGGSLIYASYNIVIVGDIRSDGALNVADLLTLQRHLLGTSSQNGAYLQSADVSGDGIVNVVDLLMLQRHLLGTSKITQTR